MVHTDAGHLCRKPTASKCFLKLRKQMCSSDSLCIRADSVHLLKSKATLLPNCSVSDWNLEFFSTLFCFLRSQNQNSLHSPWCFFSSVLLVGLFRRINRHWISYSPQNVPKPQLNVFRWEVNESEVSDVQTKRQFNDLKPNQKIWNLNKFEFQILCVAITLQKLNVKIVVYAVFVYLNTWSVLVCFYDILSVY